MPKAEKNNSKNNTIDEPVNNKDLCPSCRNPLQPDSSICPACGAPINKIGNFFYTHKSTIAAIAGILAPISVLAIIINLFISTATLKNQQRIFVEDFRPRFQLKYRSVYQKSNGSLEMSFIFINTGKTDANEIREQIILTTISDSTMQSSVFRQDVLPKSDSIKLSHTFPAVYGKIFTIEFIATYRWPGEKEEQRFESTYFALFEKSNQKYSFHIIDRKIFEGIWDIRKSLKD